MFLHYCRKDTDPHRRPGQIFNFSNDFLYSVSLATQSTMIPKTYKLNYLSKAFHQHKLKQNPKNCPFKVSLFFKTVKWAVSLSRVICSFTRDGNNPVNENEGKLKTLKNLEKMKPNVKLWPRQHEFSIYFFKIIWQKLDGVKRQGG